MLRQIRVPRRAYHHCEGTKVKRTKLVGWAVALLALLAAVLGPIPATSALEVVEFDAATQNSAAEQVMAQLGGEPLALDEIEGLEGIGPMPWLSMVPWRTGRSVEAWREVAAQLPTGEMATVGSASLTNSPLDFTESEAPGEVGGNDTPATGDFIDGFGTGVDDTPVVNITGNLIGGEVRPPIEGDCESIEDDGAIPLANPTPTATAQVSLCVGEIGDGPHGETTGDIDFYSYGVIEEGTRLILDVFNISGSLDPVNSFIGIYDAEGNLLVSEEDPGGIGGEDIFIEVNAPATAEYFAAVAGCCGLSDDPFDPASGPGVGDTGTYEVFVVALPPPCESTEDDGAIGLANPSVVGEQGFDACVGEIGDGPQAADTDFYSLGTISAGQLLVVAVEAFDTPFDGVIGLYDSSGNLVASADGSEIPPEEDFLAALLEYEIEADGEYYVAIAGCCELQDDPFDPATGAPSDEGGPYVAFMNVSDPPCRGVEDDGSISLANQLPLGEQSFAFCLGEIGDGPQDVDTDFFALGELPAGEFLVVEVLAQAEPFDAVVGLYDDEGNVVASADGTEAPDDILAALLEYEIEETGDYSIGIAGCCELQSDPFDPATGVASDATGPYAAFFTLTQPPCESVEDDGSIPLANDASGVAGDEELFENICVGFVGDGPQAAEAGDVDFFRTRELPQDRLLIVDFLDVEGTSGGAGELTIGIYNEAGELIATGQDDPNESGPDSDYFSVEVPEAGAYYVAVGGGMPTDPFDPTTGTNTDIVSDYTIMFVVDTTAEFLGLPGAGWGQSFEMAAASSAGETVSPLARRAAARAASAPSIEARLDQAKADAMAAAAAEVGTEDEHEVDVDVFLVDLKAGDAIAGGFDNARTTGIIDPTGALRQSSQFNPTFIYPESSPLRHARLNGFDHVATVDGLHAVFVTDGLGDYQGELRVVPGGLRGRDDGSQQIIFLDFDGAFVSGDVFGTGVDADLSPLSSFVARWGLDPSDEDAIIDAVVDAVVESVDQDLRVLDGRNGDRDASGAAGEFDVEILNSRDHGDRWGDPDVSRVIIGGTIDELQIPTLGIAQSIDPGNLETEETAVVLLDEMSTPPGSPVSLNTYEVAEGATKAEFVGFAVGHIAAHEIGHFIGNWHQETFNEVDALMDAGGDFPAIAGIGPDRIFGTEDDTDPDFVEDIFNVSEGFTGIEDSAGRSVFAFSTGFEELPACTITGTEGPDVLRGTDGDDVICGLGGDDKIFGKGGNDLILAGAGDDTVDAGVGDDTVYGESGDDTLRGQIGDDRLYGGADDDLLLGSLGNDVLDGGDGDDRLKSGVGDDVASGGAGDDMVLGSNGDDDLSGGDDNDQVFGGAGNDVAAGDGGNDTVAGGSGDDEVSGGDGDDTVVGGVGDDNLDGGAGTDACTEGPGMDTSVNCNP
jgi:hypothetical protein